MIIYVHDPRSPFPRYVTFTAHRDYGPAEHIVISATMSITQIAQAVVRKANRPNDIWLLVLLAHGNSGWLQFGQGLTASTASQFAAAKPYMNPFLFGVEIHGCAVASDTQIADNPFVGLQGEGRSSPTSGINMLQVLAKTLGCTVKGAIDAQRVDTDGRYNGPYVVARSNGKIEIWEGDKIKWIR
ncbi:MAG: hypothetical protein KDB03_25165 [Planctomycetales bacterium]|nr:hypothetical protein [Planctomycetales bacterium]